MESFDNVTRVRVTLPDTIITGMTGSILWRHGYDQGACIRMDDPPPCCPRLFPPDDPYERDRLLTLYPQECERA